jgi:hypothetical protein
MEPGYLEKLQAERATTLRDFSDPRQSPLAAVAREDFQGERPLRFGSAADCEVRLEGLPPHALTVRVEGDHFLVDGKPEQTGARVPLGRYTLRLSHQNFPAAVVLDEQSPRLSTGPRPQWFDGDPKLRVEGRLVRAGEPRQEVVLSTRGNRRHALHIGTFEFELEGKPLTLSALRLLEPGVGEASLSIFFRDATTGHESYPVGRYLEPAPLHGDVWVLDFNRAYNPACAFSPLYNCPIPPRENVLPVAIRAGERSPAGH